MTSDSIGHKNSGNINDKQTVLVTGGSGYVGSWAIVELLKQGYRVRTTIRNLEREGMVRAAIARQTEPGDRLSFFAADLMSDKGWDKATEGTDYVLHIATPMGAGESKGFDSIPPARDGTLRVLGASVKAGVKRVVITSSTVTALPSAGDSKSSRSITLDETTWTDLAAKGTDNYTQAKTLAERAAWDFMAEQGGSTSLSTILPVFIQGPVLGKDFASASVELVARLMSGKLPGLPRIGFNVVDVRDLVDLHIKAMLAPEAAGQRFIASSGFLWMADIAKILREHPRTSTAKVPTRKLPDLMVKLAALFNPQARFLASRLGQRLEFSSDKAKTLLGWQPRSLAETLIDGAESLNKEGIV